MPDPVQAGVESVQLSGSDRPGGGEADQGERLAAGVSLDILKGDVLTEIVDPLTRSTQEDGQHQAADLVQLSRRAPDEDPLRATRHWERLVQSEQPAAQETAGEMFCSDPDVTPMPRFADLHQAGSDDIEANRREIEVGVCLAKDLAR